MESRHLQPQKCNRSERLRKRVASILVSVRILLVVQSLRSDEEGGPPLTKAKAKEVKSSVGFYYNQVTDSPKDVS